MSIKLFSNAVVNLLLVESLRLQYFKQLHMHTEKLFKEFAHIVKFSLCFSRLSFVILLNLLQP